MEFPRGEYIFCELPDGTIGGFPSWMADAAQSSTVTLGPPLASVTALAALRALLDTLHSGPKRDKASLEPVHKERMNETKRTTIDDTDEPAAL
jgi:hypothetical protein